MNMKQKLAASLRDSLIVKTRANGDEFYCLAEGAESWMTNAVHVCHDVGLEIPNDHRYLFIKFAANALAEADDWDDINITDDPFTYNWELAAWLVNFPSAGYYVNQYIAEFGLPDKFDIFNVISCGAMMAQQETLNSLRAFIESKNEYNA